MATPMQFTTENVMSNCGQGWWYVGWCCELSSKFSVNPCAERSRRRLGLALPWQKEVGLVSATAPLYDRQQQVVAGVPRPSISNLESSALELRCLTRPSPSLLWECTTSALLSKQYITSLSHSSGTKFAHSAVPTNQQWPSTTTKSWRGNTPLSSMHSASRITSATRFPMLPEFCTLRAAPPS